MSPQAITIHLPNTFYERMRRAAQIQQRPLEKFVLDAAITGTPLLDDLPPELADEMAALALLNDAALWRVARCTLSSEKQGRLDALLQKKGRGELLTREQQHLDELLAEYEHIVFTRAHTAVLLKQRGYDISDPSLLNEPAARVVRLSPRPRANEWPPRRGTGVAIARRSRQSPVCHCTSSTSSQKRPADPQRSRTSG